MVPILHEQYIGINKIECFYLCLFFIRLPLLEKRHLFIGTPYLINGITIDLGAFGHLMKVEGVHLI